MTTEIRVSLAQSELPGDPRTAALSVFRPIADTSSRSNSAYAGGVNDLDWAMQGAVWADNCLPIKNGYTSLQQTYLTALLNGTATIPFAITPIEVQPFDLGGIVGFFVAYYRDYNNSQVGLAAYVKINQPGSPTVFNFKDAGLVGDGIGIAGLTVAKMGDTFYVGLRRNTQYSSTLVYRLFTGTWSNVDLTDTLPVSGTVAKQVHCALGNYRLLTTVDLSGGPGVPSIWYSTPGTPTDFTSYGSGQFVPIGYSGLPLGMFPIINGVIVYTTAGAWLLTQTFNGASPIKSRRIMDLQSIQNVAWDYATSTHYVVTTSGFKTVDANGNVAAFLPHLYRYLISETLVVCSPSGPPNTPFSFQDAGAANPTHRIKMYLIDTRYLVIARGTPLEYWVHDLTLNRTGKIANLQDGFWFSVEQHQVDDKTSETSMHFIDLYGSIRRYSGDNLTGSEPKAGTLVIGPLALGRNDRTNTVLGIDLGNPTQIPGGAPLRVYVHASTGTVDKIQYGQQCYDNGDGEYLCRITGSYLYVTLFGPIEVSNFVVKMTGNGM